MPEEQPNVLYLMYDQLKASATRLGGNPAMPAGFIDDMAAEGIAFTNAYSASPICTPSRTSVFTGVHPLVHQVTCHQNNAPQNLPQLSELVQDVGYYTAVAGHYEVDRNLTRGWHEQVRHDEVGDLARVYRQWVASARPDVGWGAGSIGCPAEDSSAHMMTTRVLHMLEEVERTGDPAGYVRAVLDRGERLMGFGHRVYRAEDPRARVRRRTARELGAPRFEVAEALEAAALEELAIRRPDRVLATNVEFWSAVVLDFAEVPAHMFTSMFTCARAAGWSAHVLEQKRTGRLVRPSARYIGPGPRKPEDVPGWDPVMVAPSGHPPRT